MATYYVDKIGETIKYRLDAWPDASNGTVPNPNDLNQLCFDVGVDHTIVLSARTWSGTEIDATDGLDLGRTGQTLRGPLLGDPGYIGKVTPSIDGTGLNDHVVNIGVVAAYTLKNLLVRGAAANMVNLYMGGATVAEDVILEGGYQGFKLGAAAAATLRRVVIRDAASFIGEINASGSSLRTELCQMLGNAGALRVLSGNYTDKNSLFLGTGHGHVFVSGNNAQQVTLNNSILGTWGVTNTGTTGLDNQTTNAVCAANNCLLLNNPRSKDITQVGFALNGCVTDRSPKFRQHRRQGIISLVLDDNVLQGDGVTFWAESFADMVEARGLKFTWATTSERPLHPTDWSLARNLYARGHDVVPHSANHANLGTRDALNIQYTGAGTEATYAYDRTTGIITVAVTGAAHGFTFDTTGKSVGDFQAYLTNFATGFGAWTVTAPLSVGTANTECHAADLNAMLPTDCKTAPLTLAFDIDAFFQTEIIACRDTFAAEIPGWEPTAWAYSVGGHDILSRQALADAGFCGARALTAGDYLLSSTRIFQMYAGLVGQTFGLEGDSPTPEQIRRRVHALCDYLKYVGGHMAIYAHGDGTGTDFGYDGTADYGAESWAIVLDALRDNGITVMPLTQAYQYIADQAEATTGEGGETTYTRSEAHLGDALDIRTRPGSPCRDAGLDVGLTADFLGRAVPHGTAPDIGPSESGYDNFRRRRLVGGQRFGAQAINR